MKQGDQRMAGLCFLFQFWVGFRGRFRVGSWWVEGLCKFRAGLGFGIWAGVGGLGCVSREL